MDSVCSVNVILSITELIFCQCHLLHCASFCSFWMNYYISAVPLNSRGLSWLGLYFSQLTKSKVLFLLGMSKYTCWLNKWISLSFTPRGKFSSTRGQRPKLTPCLLPVVNSSQKVACKVLAGKMPSLAQWFLTSIGHSTVPGRLPGCLLNGWINDWWNEWW